MYGLSTKTASNTNKPFLWHGGTGMFAVTPDASWVGSVSIKLEHNLSADGGEEWKSLGADAEFTAAGQTIFTSAATHLRVVLADSGGAEVYHVVVQPVRELSAY